MVDLLIVGSGTICTLVETRCGAVPICCVQVRCVGTLRTPHTSGCESASSSSSGTRVASTLLRAITYFDISIGRALSLRRSRAAA
eukprot:355645-Chlamydomonas_euryale.AAC.14